MLLHSAMEGAAICVSLLNSVDVVAVGDPCTELLIVKSAEQPWHHHLLLHGVVMRRVLRVMLKWALRRRAGCRRDR